MATIAAGTSSTLYIPIAQSLTITPGTSGKASLNGRNQDGSEITPQEIYTATTISVRAGATITVDAVNVDATCTDVADSLSSVSGGGAVGVKSWMSLGDSITAQGSQQRSPIADPFVALRVISVSLPNINSVGTFVVAISTEYSCPTGNGTLRYYAASKGVTWQANGDTEGAPVYTTTAGHFRVESGSTGKAVFVSMQNANRPATDKSDTVNVTGTPQLYRGSATGYTFWADILTDNQAYYHLNYGISGGTSSDIWNSRSQWQGRRTDITLIHLGTNQSNDLTAAAQSVSDIEKIIRARLEVGSTCIVGLLFPQDALTAAQQGAKDWHDSAVSEMCGRLGVECWSALPYLSAQASTDRSYASATYKIDATHPSGLGTYIAAKRAFLPALQRVIGAQRRRQRRNTAYNSSTAPFGNLLTNGKLTGTAGTASTRVTGTVPDSMTALCANGSVMSAVGSLQARDDGVLGNWAQFLLTNTGGANDEQFNFAQSSAMSDANFTVGDYVVFEGELKISGVGISGISLSAGPALQKTGASITGGTVLENLDGDTLTFSFKSFPMKIESTATNNLSMNVFMRANGVATVGFSDLAYRKVPAPTSPA